MSSLLKSICLKVPRVNITKILQKQCRDYSGIKQMKVAVVGAAGRIGQPLCLMLKQSPYIDELAMCDINNVNSIATELAFMDTKCRVTSAKGSGCAQFALEDAKVVVITAAVPGSNVMAESAMFEANAELIRDLAEMCSQYCPQALFAVATDPINSLVPLFSEVLKKNGTYNPKAVFGVTTLNVVRANTFVAEVLGLEPECVVVPVVGGNSELTIVPLLSHAKPIAEFTIKELETLTVNIQKAQQNIIKERKNKGPALSSAFAIARFTIALVKGLIGHPNIVECAFVKTLQFENTKYFASAIELGVAGMQRNLGVPTVLTNYEKCLIDTAIPLVAQDVKKGELFVGVKDPPEPCDICIPEPKSPKCPPDWCEKRANRTLYD